MKTAIYLLGISLELSLHPSLSLLPILPAWGSEQHPLFADRFSIFGACCGFSTLLFSCIFCFPSEVPFSYVT